MINFLVLTDLKGPDFKLSNTSKLAILPLTRPFITI